MVASMKLQINMSIYIYMKMSENIVQLNLKIEYNVIAIKLY